MPSLVGGSADLAESNLTDIKGGGAFSPGSSAGRNIHFGIREHAMGAIANGLAYDGLFIPFVATFLQFADYMRPAVRLAALSKLQIDLRLDARLDLPRRGRPHAPADRAPHRAARHPEPARGPPLRRRGGRRWRWAHALHAPRRPDRARPLPPEDRGGARATRPVRRRGGFARAATWSRDAPAGARSRVLATGSEVALAQAAIDLLAQKGVQARLVSMPCLQCFEAQPAA